MEGLRDSDLRAALDFLETAWGVSGLQAFPQETLEALARLIPCDGVGYSELDRVNQREIEYVGTEGDAGDEDVFWSIVNEHPLCRHQQAYADFSATRLSDVISRRELLVTRVYADWFRPAGVVAELEVGINRSRIRTRTFVFSRMTGDFSLRDRAMLDRLAPHLARIHETAQLRLAAERADPGNLDRLTTREAEILELLSAGLTNAAIAERLWISPGTVKKHLDNVYAKLGVANRTAAVARVGRLDTQARASALPT
jgi:DNA-binding CsgD family transcriptional regulator